MQKQEAHGKAAIPPLLRRSGRGDVRSGRDCAAPARLRSRGTRKTGCGRRPVNAGGAAARPHSARGPLGKRGGEKGKESSGRAGKAPPEAGTAQKVRGDGRREAALMAQQGQAGRV